MIGLVKNTGLVIREGLVKGKGLVKLRPTFPSILSDGNTVKWFDYLENVTKDGSDLVSIWDNKTGIPGIIPGALLQATPLDKGKWFLNDGILFDGIRQFMKTLSFTFVQPEMIYIVIKQVTWNLNARIFDGNFSFSGYVFQSPNTPSLRASAGTSSLANANAAINTFAIMRVLLNGASSTFQIDETTQFAGDYGAANMGGFTLSRIGNLGSWSNIQVKEIILRKIADTAQDNQDIYDYLANKYSI